MRPSSLEFRYTLLLIVPQLFHNYFQHRFVQGTVAFSSKGDRIAWTLIEQMINGQYNKVGYYDTQTDNLTWLAEARWIRGKIPQDKTEIIGK